MKDSILIYGTDTSFNKRAADLLRRDYKIVEIEHKIKYNDDGEPTLEVPSPEMIFSELILNNVKYFFFSSESLLLLNNREDFIKLKSVIELITKNSNSHICLFAAFDYPYPINKSRISSTTDKNFQEFLQELRKCCKESNSLVFNYEKYFTHVESNLQFNPIGCAEDLEYHLNGNSADDIILNIIDNIKSENITNPIPEKYSFDVKLYSDCRSKLYDETTQNIDAIEYSYEGILAHQKECSVEILYRKDPGEQVRNRPIAELRFNMGINLFKQIPMEVINKLEYIIPVPETGKYYAQGFAAASKVPYIEAFYKRKKSGRSFDINDKESRNLFINKKLGIYPELIDNKVIGLIDEAIFTGSTLKIAVHLLQSAKVKEIYIFIPSPICKLQCNFNMQPKRVMLSSYITKENLNDYFGVNGVYFQNLNVFQNTMRVSGFACIKCFK